MGTLTGPLKTLLESFTGHLDALYGRGLVSVIVYGSATADGYHAEHSDINLAIVLTDTAIPTLAKAHRLVNERRYRAIHPVFFTEKHIRSSLDVFPLEFLDMQERYIMVYGKDVLKDIRVDTRHLRFQCEHELKSKLIAIKSAYLRTQSGTDARELLFRSCTSLLHILRNLLRLKGKVPPHEKDALITDIETAFGVDAKVIRSVLAIKQRGEYPGYAAADALIAELAALLERIADSVDKG